MNLDALTAVDGYGVVLTQAAVPIYCAYLAGGQFSNSDALSRRAVADAHALIQAAHEYAAQQRAAVTAQVAAARQPVDA